MGKTLSRIGQALVEPVKVTSNLVTHPLQKDAWQGLASYATNPDVTGLLPDSWNEEVRNAIPVGLSFVPGIGPALGAGYSAANSFGESGRLGQSLLKGAGSYAGSTIGGNLGNSFLNGGANSIANMGTIGGAVSNTLGSSAANALSSYGPSIAGSSLGGALGSTLGGSIGGELGASLGAPKAKAASPWAPSQESQSSMPTSLLDSLGGMSPLQQSTNLASRGAYGGGLGPEEQKYFLNQENRRLVDESGNVSSMDSLSPVEMSYLQKMGLGGYSNSNDLLKAMSQWQAA